MLKSFSTGKLSLFVSFIKASLKGEEHDFTTGSLRKAVILLAIPMMLEMSMESVFALVDLYFVGRLGKHAVSTVGLTESVLAIVYSLAIGISMAATAIIARRIGEKQPAAAGRAALQAIWIALVIVVVVSAGGIASAGSILRLMGAEPVTVATGAVYTRIMFASSLPIVFLFLINGIFRGAGNAAMAMKSLGLANLCNIILCPLLIYGAGPIPAMGLMGAALATTTGRSIGVCYQFYHLFRGKGQVKIHREGLSPDWPVIRTIVKTAWPGTLQFIIGSCSWIFMAQLVADTGHSAASAGYQTALRIVMFFILPAWGVSNAAATLVGQNLGAQEFQRAEQAVYKTAKYNALMMATVLALFFALANPLVALFAYQQDVREVASQALRIISTGYIFYGIGMVLTSAFNGAGDTRTPTIINVFAFWCFQIPFAYLLAKHFGLGPKGVFLAIPITESLITVAAYILFRRGRWKKVKV